MSYYHRTKQAAIAKAQEEGYENGRECVVWTNFEAFNGHVPVIRPIGLEAKMRLMRDPDEVERILTFAELCMETLRKPPTDKNRWADLAAATSGEPRRRRRSARPVAPPPPPPPTSEPQIAVTATGAIAPPPPPPVAKG